MFGTLLTNSFRDAFAGGFVAGIVEGKSLEQSIDMGHWLASLSIKELGPQYVSTSPSPSSTFIVPHCYTNERLHDTFKPPSLSFHKELTRLFFHKIPLPQANLPNEVVNNGRNQA